MKRLLSIFTILILVYYAIGTSQAQAAAKCTFLEIGDTFTLFNDESSCQFYSATDGIEKGTESINTANIVIPAGKQLLVQNPDSTPQSITVGSINLQNGSSIVIPDGSNIYLGAALFMKDTDEDTYVGAAEPQIMRAPDLNYRLRRNALAHREIDCDDTNASVNLLCDGNPSVSPTLTPFPTYIQPSPTITPTPACKNAGEACLVNGDCCSPNNCTDFYQDSDTDTYGNASVTTKRCGATYSGYVTNNTDCDDAQSTVWVTHAACYWDLDTDTYTNGNTSGKTCINNASCNSATKGSLAGGAAPTTYSAGQLKDNANSTDCCDTDNRAYPGATTYYTTTRTTCGGYDYNCDGSDTPPAAAPGQCAQPWAYSGYIYCRSGCWYNMKGMGNRTCGASGNVIQGWYWCINDYVDACIHDEEGQYYNAIVDTTQSCTISCR